MLALLLKMGLSEKWAGRLATPLLILAIVLIVAPLSYCKGRSDGHDAAMLDVARESLEVAGEVAASHDQADVERQDDLSTTEERREARDEAIRNAEGDGRPSRASDALNCERLRAHGVSTANIPACR